MHPVAPFPQSPHTTWNLSVIIMNIDCITRQHAVWTHHSLDPLFPFTYAHTETRWPTQMMQMFCKCLVRVCVCVCVKVHHICFHQNAAYPVSRHGVSTATLVFTVVKKCPNIPPASVSLCFPAPCHIMSCHDIFLTVTKLSLIHSAVSLFHQSHQVFILSILTFKILHALPPLLPFPLTSVFMPH